MSFTVRVHPDVDREVPSSTAFAPLRTAFPYPEATLHFWPRAKAAEALGRVTPPYAWRAVTRGPEPHILVDTTETPESLLWVAAHELGHHRAARLPAVKQELARARPMDLDPTSDLFHALDPEERYADGLAHVLLGTRYDRSWWRPRTPVRTSFGRVTEVPSTFPPLSDAMATLAHTWLGRGVTVIYKDPNRPPERPRIVVEMEGGASAAPPSFPAEVEGIPILIRAPGLLRPKKGVAYMVARSIPTGVDPDLYRPTMAYSR